MKLTTALKVFVAMFLFGLFVYLINFGAELPKSENSNYIWVVLASLVFIGFLGFIIPRPGDSVINGGGSEGADAWMINLMMTVMLGVFGGLAYIIELAMLIQNDLSASFWTMIVGSAISLFYIM